MYSNYLIIKKFTSVQGKDPGIISITNQEIHGIERRNVSIQELDQCFDKRANHGNSARVNPLNFSKEKSSPLINSFSIQPFPIIDFTTADSQLMEFIAESNNKCKEQIQETRNQEDYNINSKKSRLIANSDCPPPPGFKDEFIANIKRPNQETEPRNCQNIHIDNSNAPIPHIITSNPVLNSMINSFPGLTFNAGTNTDAHQQRNMASNSNLFDVPINDAFVKSNNVKKGATWKRKNSNLSLEIRTMSEFHPESAHATINLSTCLQKEERMKE